MEDIFEELAEVDDYEDDKPGEDEAIEASTGDNKRIVKPAKKRVMRVQPKLDAMRLTGPRGIEVLEKTFENIKYKGKGHELEDLTNVLSHLQHWAHRLYPKANFQDCIDKIEDLGSKKAVSVNMTKLRLGMLDSVTTQLSDEEINPQSPQDPFDLIIGSQPESLQTPSITDEQRERMMRNRLIAEERRRARMQATQEQENTIHNSEVSLLENSTQISTREQDISTLILDDLQTNLTASNNSEVNLLENSTQISTREQDISALILDDLQTNLTASNNSQTPDFNRKKSKENIKPTEPYEPVAGPSWLSDWHDFQPSPPHST